MARFIRFPGVAGSYVDTDDVNLLGADAAHVFQSSTIKVKVGSSITLTPIVGVPGATMGGNAAQFQSTVNGDSSVYMDDPVTIPTLGLSPLTLYSSSARVRTLGGVDRSARIILVWWNSGGGYVGETPAGTSVTLPANGDWVTLNVSGTSVADTAISRTDVHVSDALIGEDFQIDVSCTREGADSTFVPSLRIVGDIDIEQDVEPDLWLPATGEFVMSSRDSTDSTGYGALLLSNGNVFTYYGDGVTDRSLQLTHGLTTGRHVLRQTFTVADGVWKLFVDGSEVDTGAGTVGAGAVGDNNPLSFGADRLGAGTQFFAGRGFTGTVRDGIGGPVVAEFDAEDLGL